MTPSDLPQNQAELMQRIEQDWTELMNLVGQLSEAQLEGPLDDGWSAKDHLAHLAAWERHLLLAHLQGRPVTESLEVDEATAVQYDIDTLNEIIYRRNQPRPANEVLAELCETHAQVVAVLVQIPFERLMQPRYPDRSNPLLQWAIGNTYEHYQEHRATIQTLLD
jgi:hypothetical protein